MKHLQAGDKIIRQMTRDGAVELNKATGEAANISARDSPGIGYVGSRKGDTSDTSGDSHNLNAPGGNRGDDSLYVIGGVVDRVQMERKAAKRRIHKKANAEIYKQSQSKPEISRLKFTDAELADPAMSKHINKTHKAIKGYEKAQGKIPKKKSLSIERVSDKPKGKTETRLIFVEGNKPINGSIANGKLKHALERPGREAANLTHKEISKHEGDNSGVQAAHSAEKAAEGAARKIGAGYRHLKLSPYRSALRHDRKAVKANVNALYQRSLRQNPNIKNAGAVRKALHKRYIKKQYAKSLRAAKTGAQGAAGAVKKAGLIKTIAVKAALMVKLAAVKAAKLATLKVLLPVGALVLIMLFLMAGISSCVAMLGGFGQVIATSYTAEDEDILGAHGDYTAFENHLADRIANIPSEFPGYDEYRFYLDPIEHDPHELTAFLTALYMAFTQDEVQATMQNLFNQQYILTITLIVEIRTRQETRTGSWTDSEGNTHTYTYTVTVQYEWHVLVTTLVNRTIREVAANILNPEQYEMFLVLLQTQGNRPDLFGGDGLSIGLAGYVLHEQIGTMLFDLFPAARGRGATQTQGQGADGLIQTQVTGGNISQTSTQGLISQAQSTTAANIPPAYLVDSRFAAMIAEAEQFLGYRYVWGGSNPATGFDCSGFVSWVINQSGAGSVGRSTANGLYNHTVTIPPEEVRPGDLVFFQGTWNTPGASHVGIYTGGGMMIHTGSNPAGVSFVSIHTAYWERHFKAFGRLP